MYAAPTPDAIIHRNNVKQLGQGDVTLMLAHGFGCDQSMWRFVAPALLDRYRVVLFDYVGSGRSEAAAYDPLRYDRLDGYASDVLALADEQLEHVLTGEQRHEEQCDSDDAGGCI